MNQVTISLVGLILILVVASFVLKESFVDASGASVTISLSDLLGLIGKNPSNTQQPKPVATPVATPVAEKTTSSLNSQFAKDLKSSIMTDVNSLLSKQSLSATAAPVLTDSCIDSVVNQQGADFMRYVPGKNPDDYIRKDSIPCYSCNL